MSDGSSSDQRPIFSLVGKTRGSGQGRSAGLMLVVVVGLGASVLTFVWEQASRVFVRTVQVTFLPEEADAADAAIRAQRDELLRQQAEAATATGGAATTSPVDTPESAPRTTGSPGP